MTLTLKKTSFEHEFQMDRSNWFPQNSALLSYLECVYIQQSHVYRKVQKVDFAYVPSVLCEYGSSLP